MVDIVQVLIASLAAASVSSGIWATVYRRMCASKEAVKLEARARADALQTDLNTHLAQTDAARRQEHASHAASELLLTQLGQDLRTQLNSLLGMTDLLLETEVSALQQEYLKDLLARAELLATGVNDFLDLGRWQTGTLRLEQLDFHLRDTVASTVNAVVATARRKRILLDHAVAADVPDVLVGDPGRLRQILVSLLDAIIGAAEGGELSVKVERESETADQLLLRFTFSHGGGIDPDRIMRLSDGDRTADKTTRLAALLCGQWIDLMGGRLHLDPPAGGGFTLHFTAHFQLPSKEPVVQALEPPVIRSLPVLVICDREGRKRDLIRMLAASGMNPTSTFNSRSALDIVQEQDPSTPFGLIIIDWLPPGDDPFSLAAHIKEILRLTRIVLLVSVGLRGDITRCREAGVSAYVTRPVTPSDLMDTIMTVMATDTSDGTVITRHTMRQGKRTLRILLAEDNSVNQSIGLSLLESRGHTVICARNGREALQAFQRGVFDLILTDIQMPELDGYQLTRRIREVEGSGKHVPIIAVTANSTNVDRERCLRAGMDGYVTKPLTPFELFEEIDLVIDKEPSGEASTRILDPRVALEHCSGNMKLLKDKTHKLLDGLDGDVRRLQAALKAGEWSAVRSTIGELSARWEDVGALPVATHLASFAARADSQPAEAVDAAFITVLRMMEEARSELLQLEPEGPPRILVAEDDSVSRLLLEDLLVEWGYEVVVVSDGLAAWRALQADDPPRVAILDWMMPNMDGVQVCREVRRWRDEPYIYLILLTTRSEKEDIISGLDAGADDYLVKAFDANELKVRLRAGLRIIKLQEELISARDTMRHQATHDALTGVLNRRALLESIQVELARVQRQEAAMGLMMLDLDHFKKINDTFGHQAGDAVLREVARRLKEGFRPYEIVGRYGGEEFVVALPGCDLRNAEAQAERLRRRIAAEPVITLEGTVPVSASIGVCSTSQTGARDRLLLLRAVDLALYRAKHEGRNCVRLAGSADFAQDTPSR